MGDRSAADLFVLVFGASAEILRIQMLALVQRCLGHCQPARSCFLKRQGPVRINSLIGDQRLFFKIDNYTRDPFHFVFRRSISVKEFYSRAKLIDR